MEDVARLRARQAEIQMHRRMLNIEEAEIVEKIINYSGLVAEQVVEIVEVQDGTAAQ